MAVSITDKDTRDAIAEVLQSAAATISEPVRIKKRWALSLKGDEWMSSLRSLTSDKRINGWFITRTGMKSVNLGHNHWEYTWTYALYYFRSYDEISENSEEKLNELLEATAHAFEQVTDFQHDELQVINIDTIDLRVHVARCQLAVRHTYQG